MSSEYIVSVTACRMLAILSETRQPFRLQSNVTIVVPYEEYCEYVEKMCQGKIGWLSYSLSIYRKASKEASGGLLRKLYYFDISEAIYSECRIAVTEGKDVTNIRPTTLDELDGVSKEDLLMQSCETSEIKAAILSLKREGSGINVAELVGRNRESFCYAVYLRVLSKR